MANIGTIIAQKNETRGDRKVAALTTGHANREHHRTVERNDRSAERRSNCGSRYSDSTPFFDGTDHINLWDRGRTELGRALSLDSDLNIEVQGLGKFRSFYALWVYLTTKHRSMMVSDAPAYQLRKMARERKAVDNFVEPENFRYVIMAALWDYVTADKDLVDALILSGEVSIVSYVEQNEQRTLHSHSKWWVPMVRMVRATLIAGETELDLSFLRDAPGTYDEIVKSFRSSNQLLGRIKRAPVKAAPVKAEPKPKKAKVVDAAPYVREEGIKDTTERRKTILGYDPGELYASFSKDGGFAFRVFFIGDVKARNRLLFSAIGRKIEDVLQEVRDESRIPNGSHLNPDHYLKLNEDKDGVVIGASSCEFPNPLEQDGQTIFTHRHHDDDALKAISKASNNRHATRAVIISHESSEADNTHYTLKVVDGAPGGYMWAATPKVPRSKAPQHESEIIPENTIFLGAPLSEEQATTGKHTGLTADQFRFTSEDTAEVTKMLNHHSEAGAEASLDEAAEQPLTWEAVQKAMVTQPATFPPATE